MSRPIFIIGSPRSGTSVLTWSLGQHPNIYPLEETAWIGRFGRELIPTYQLGSAREERSHLSALGITQEEFFRRFGDVINRLILDHRAFPKLSVEEDTPFTLIRRPGDPKDRWVDGTPENSLSIEELEALFPNAQFIFLFRDVGAVARSLMNFDQLGATAYPADEACQQWLRAIEPCLAAEQRSPPAKFMRLPFSELEQTPRQAVRRCLDFLGEPWNDDCLKPLAHRINSSAPPVPDVRIGVEEATLASINRVYEALGLIPPGDLEPLARNEVE